jgi:hypothetical protein
LRATTPISLPCCAILAYGKVALRFWVSDSDDSLYYELPTFGDFLSQIKSWCSRSKTVGLS